MVRNEEATVVAGVAGSAVVVSGEAGLPPSERKRNG